MEASSYAEQAVTAKDRELADPQTALAELYDTHAAAVYRLLLAILGSAADAQDALSEIFLKLARQNLSRINDPRSYLLASARNQAIQTLRHRKRETPTDPADLVFFDTTALKPEQALMAEQVAAALQELPPEQREVVVLKVYEEMTFEEIAQITHTRPNTVASRYRYAAEKLRKLLRG